MGSFDLYRPQIRRYIILIHFNMLYATFIPTIVYLDLPLEAQIGPNGYMYRLNTAQNLLVWSQNRVGKAQKLLHSIRKGGGMLQEQVWGLKSL